MSVTHELSKRPLRLVQNKLIRYPGGREIDRFRGISPPMDDGRPEAWVGSTTLAVNRTADDPTMGIAEVYVAEAEKRLLTEVIAADPEGLLGVEHVARNGSNPALLVKLLDAERQLGLQSHPDRAFAKKHFHSDYGKVESWYVIGLRDDSPEQPYVLLGFKEGVTRKRFQELFLAGDIGEMERCCHKIPAQIGDMYFVDAGVPHAVGPGCFLVEVQEPSDITVGARMREIADPEERAAFIERTMGCYHYDGRSYADNLTALRIPPQVLRQSADGVEKLLLGQAQTSFFSVTRLELTGEMAARQTGTFSIVIVLAGQGTLRYPGGELALKRADELFLPAGVGEMTWVSGDSGLTLVRCYPPDVL